MAAPMPNPHDRTRKPKPEAEHEEEEEEDPIDKLVNASGCADQHFALLDCMAEKQDWRKCQEETKKFRLCMAEAQKKKQQEKR
ncbi:COA4 [Branchiostoma lanceolatum]|uniref:COA4 protein n=1 Tax=Branchiostoma lanceolatum TaxID=7740 RepID=A0A8J9ZWX9_BRALA|nr:COA4 [Branchiostoma lanceolatum]